LAITGSNFRAALTSFVMPTLWISLAFAVASS
jgi:hypothetical protein